LEGYDKGRRHYTRRFIVFVRPREELEGPWRLGVTVSGKVGSAVRRNRIKRLVREYFRLNRERIPDGRDFIVVAKRGLKAERLNLAQVENDLQPLIAGMENDFAHKPGFDTGS
jgi:ribonuclease P protein component